MTVNRAVSIFAGFMVMASLALAHFTGQINLGQMSWLWLTAFVGANLFQMGFTGFCPAARILKALGLKDATSACGTGNTAGKCC
ncbi:MAG: DUF2892 domain-containing protein [Polaromonas sp.]|uniref:YgaP family membrane protein n=1 Tax=Polaromonas sp. TaxID=1869339 RepID=UPI00272F0672|nr:DUF2892 domain-containing protein [Polaromonas sp.]MDP2449616.1 DUF2892 domain-containing protein [Polaromonas sp.]MDP3250037.1 DUF2892 domain-containing protein [Polaromonas sp.]MDP3754025.1 DUF2892 domain-containing protein [Polaromonas sp.]